MRRRWKCCPRSVKAHLGAAAITGDAKVSKVSVVGVGMRSHVGIASQMFRTLSEEGINIQMISTSEIKISVLIDEKYMELAVRALHKAFELEKAISFCPASPPPVDRARFCGYDAASLSLATVQRQKRRRGRVVEGTSLLRKHTGLNLYRGFESLRLRQRIK
jgi:predicted amino acid-binding ACT domain protein